MAMNSKQNETIQTLISDNQELKQNIAEIGSKLVNARNDDYRKLLAELKDNGYHFQL